MVFFGERLSSDEAQKDFGEQDVFRTWMKYAVIIAVLFCVVGLAICFVVEHRAKTPPAVADETKPESGNETTETTSSADLHNPVRPAPASFPRDSNMPQGREVYASGPIDLTTFNPEKDLTRFEDKRVWFDSDNKANPVEDDHTIHRAMQVPLKRLVNLLEKKGGKLKVHDAYRPADKNTIHAPNSLHCEGRAIDLTGEDISLSELAKLAWQAGFDFVLYEKPGRSGGEHLHCSVKRDPNTPLPERPGSATPKPN